MTTSPSAAAAVWVIAAYVLGIPAAAGGLWAWFHDGEPRWLVLASMALSAVALACVAAAVWAARTSNR